MIPETTVSITFEEPNWKPLERVLPTRQCEDFMYMGRAGEIELYKHHMTRRYLYIGRDTHAFYRYVEGGFVEISQNAALEYVYG